MRWADIHFGIRYLIAVAEITKAGVGPESPWANETLGIIGIVLNSWLFYFKNFSFFQQSFSLKSRNFKGSNHNDVLLLYLGSRRLNQLDTLDTMLRKLWPRERNAQSIFHWSYTSEWEELYWWKLSIKKL